MSNTQKQVQMLFANVSCVIYPKKIKQYHASHSGSWETLTRWNLFTYQRCLLVFGAGKPLLSFPARVCMVHLETLALPYLTERQFNFFCVYGVSIQSVAQNYCVKDVEVAWLIFYCSVFFEKCFFLVGLFSISILLMVE